MKESNKQTITFYGWHFDGDMHEQLKHSRIIGDTSGEFVEYLIERCQRAEGLTNSQALEIETGKAISDAAKFHLQVATDLIKSLKLELAEERAACKIAGHAMDAMRATIDRKDEEIRLLRDVAEAEQTEYRGGGDYMTAVDNRKRARAALEAFDK